MAANAITRPHIREAMSNSNCPVPDFTQREKATLAWSKVYIDLGQLHRGTGIHYLVGCIRYGNTIFTDKATLEKVKEYFYRIKTAPAYLHPIAKELFPKAKKLSDFTCLHYMLDYYLRVAAREDVRDDLYDVLRDVDYKLTSGRLEEGFSGKFLLEAFSLARKNLKRNPDDLMCAVIERVLCNSRGHNQVVINNALPEEIADLFVEKIASAKKTLDSIEVPNTQKGFLKALGVLKKIKQDLDFPKVMRRFPNDEKQIAGRLYFTADLSDRVAQNYLNLCQIVKTNMKDYRAAVMKDLSSSFRIAYFGIGTDSFSASCQDYQRSVKGSWRERIADELSKDADYRTLVEARIRKEDSVLEGFTFEEYCQWIRDPQSPIGRPELTALSKITQRPVLVVHSKGGHFEWIKGINLDFDEDPLIFNFNEGVWSPVEENNFEELPPWET